MHFVVSDFYTENSKKASAPKKNNKLDAVSQSGKDRVGPHIHKKGIFSGISHAVPCQVSAVVCNLISATAICGCLRGT